MYRRIKNHLRMNVASLGLASRVVASFILVFGLMGSVGLYLMKRSLLPTFETIDRKAAYDAAKRVLSGIDEQLVSLSVLNHDWAYWDEMYEHLLKPNQKFQVSNIGPAAMATSNLNAVMLMNLKGEVIGFGARALSNERTPQMRDILGILLGRWQGEAQHIPVTKCGLSWVLERPASICWTGVVHSDGSHPPSGTVVMVRELEPDSLKNIAANAGIDFKLDAPGEVKGRSSEKESSLQMAKFQYLPALELTLISQDTVIDIHSTLPGLNGRSFARVDMRIERQWMVQAEKLLTDMMMQWAVVAFVSGFMLISVIQRWLVRPVARLRTDLASLGESKRWDSVLKYDRPDEIGELTKGINALLLVLHEQVRKLESVSRTDALTGIANRRKLDERMTLELSRLARHAVPLSLLLIDVDHFKRYNDTYGHPEGDAALRKVAAVLASCSRQQDLAARFGGEEFAVLLPNTDESGARSVAEKIMQGMSALNIPHAQSPTSPRLSVSIGGTTWLEIQSGGAETLISQADKALYVAKRDGRMRASFYNG
ncbi:sensor domain-containing diguanylate cyclase [Rhodoferax mekongensis]|uniref:sensor domain-containing diguanylate cyclase n=1 Tax=Rhodoferax mekongensis TaxID=3068341 RepID=UPI0028BE1FD9|nr:diguanylate cyclase [Rhodoferax sp. TBRC 17199]MDT7515498.1 diguanylate cyclase [Rhodoferax sp. TBRC 17199]